MFKEMFHVCKTVLVINNPNCMFLMAIKRNEIWFVSAGPSNICIVRVAMNKWKIQLFHKATSKTWTQTLKNLEPEKPRPWKTWTLKNLDPENHRINIRLKNMSDFRELCFIKTMRNVIYCLKIRVLADI